MKKSRILGYALTLAATLMVGSAMGQDVKGGANYVELKNQTPTGAQTTPAPASLEQESLIQINKDYGYFAKPSEGFHPGYVSATLPTPSWVLTKDFKWSWSATAKPGTATVTFSNPTGVATGSANDMANFTKIKVNEKGPYTIQVQETAPLAFGACTGTASSFFIKAFDAPSFVMSTPANYNPICGPNTVAVPFSAVITSSGTPTVKYRLEKWSVTINPAAGTKAPNAIINPVIVQETETFINATTQTGWSYDVNVGEKYVGQKNGKAAIEVATKLDAATQKLATYNFVYTAAANDLAAPAAGEGQMIVYRLYVEGVNGLISRRADYTQEDGSAPASFTLYPATAPLTTDAANYYDVYVAAAPKTGPVYHINNNIAK